MGNGIPEEDNRFAIFRLKERFRRDGFLAEGIRMRQREKNRAANGKLGKNAHTETVTVSLYVNKEEKPVLISRESFDVGTEVDEFVVDVLVATVDVIDSGNLGVAFCGEAGQKQRCRGAEVTCHDGCGT